MKFIISKAITQQSMVIYKIKSVYGYGIHNYVIGIKVKHTDTIKRSVIFYSKIYHLEADNKYF